MDFKGMGIDCELLAEFHGRIKAYGAVWSLDVASATSEGRMGSARVTFDLGADRLRRATRPAEFEPAPPRRPEDL